MLPSIPHNEYVKSRMLHSRRLLPSAKTCCCWRQGEDDFGTIIFLPVKIPTITHIPLVHKNIPIPTGLLDEVIQR